MWLLDNSDYVYSRDQAEAILAMLHASYPFFVCEKNIQLKIKIDSLLQTFIEQQSRRFPELKLE